MRYYKAYRWAVRLLPAPGGEKTGIAGILRRHRVKTGAVCVFHQDGAVKTVTAGKLRDGSAVTGNTCFRTASVSKMVCAMLAQCLAEQGKMDLDGDAAGYLGCALRNPGFPDVVITPRMLLSHTSSLMDTPAYWQSLREQKTLAECLQTPVFGVHRPGERFVYSNFGAGVLGAVLEGASGMTLDALLGQTFPGVTASFYPQNLPEHAKLADCCELLPPKMTYDAAALRARPAVAEGSDPQKHWGVGHGNLCISALDLKRIAREAIAGYQALRVPHVPFGPRDPHITEGLGMFIVNDPSLCPRTVYGHQGLAYGAVNGVFFDPTLGKGFVLLTGGASVAREYVLADVNRDLIREILGGENI